MADVGDKVSFTLPDQDGTDVTVPSGRWTVLYFYPRDDTPGCTTEACGFRDRFDAFTERGVDVLGVSTDSVRRHRTFATKYDLPFTLVSDKEGELVDGLDVRSERGSARRVTFILDGDGVVRHVFPKVSPKTHTEEVLEVLDGLLKKPAE